MSFLDVCNTLPKLTNIPEQFLAGGNIGAFPRQERES